MWTCQKCGEGNSFQICWNCGTLKDGLEHRTNEHTNESALTSTQSTACDDESVFDQTQIKEFRSAAYWMGIAGRLGILFGILACFGIVELRVDFLIAGILAIIVGVWTLDASGAFRKVAQRKGDDIQQLVFIAASLKKIFRLQIILMLIAVVTIVAILATGLLSR